jgi:alkylation response protein AidB-like acyl-CoA dehydrogenase
MDLSTILRTAQDIGQSTIKPESISADKNAEWVSRSMKALQDARLTGLVVPQKFGGMGHGLHALVRVCETLGTYYSSAGLCYGMHCVGSAVIASKATEWQIENYLKPIAEGKHITTLALSETGTGSHFYVPETGLKSEGNNFLLNGEKTFVTNGKHADSYVVSMAAVDETASPGEFSCAIVDLKSKGVSWGEKWEGLGMRGNSSTNMHLVNVPITGDRILGEKGDQLWYVFNVIAPYFLCAMAGTYLGVAEAAFNEAKNAVSKRNYNYNGTKLSQVSLIQNKLGHAYEKLQMSKALIHNAAMAGDQGLPEAMSLIFCAKTAAANCAVDLVNEAMTLAGGIGYRSNGTLGMLLRDARAAHVMAPTTDILYTWIGRTLLEQPLLTD